MKKYRVHCETCGQVPDISATKPTECPNNPAHTIVPADTVILIDRLFELKSNSTIMLGVVAPTAVDPAWEEVGAVVVDVNFIIPNLAKAIGRFVGDYKTSGAGVKVRIMEYKDGEADSQLKQVTLPNTADAWAHDSSVDTDPSVVEMRDGRNRYTLECQLPDGGTSAEFRDGTLALIEQMD